MANLYTRADVAERNGRKGAPVWFVIKDVVYDATAYLQEHPGGAAQLYRNAGKDASKVFEQVGDSADSRIVLEKYRIGEIVEEEKRYDANSKKKKRVVEAQPGGGSRSCLNIICCGLHPGGVDPFQEQAGKDATKEFESVGHSVDAREIMKKYRIGEIVEEERHYDGNGKKKKRVVEAQPEGGSRSCLNIICCGLVG